MIKEFPYKNEIYKSKGELEIAKFLTKKNINFTYEKPIRIKLKRKYDTWYPDFYLNDYNIIIEYFGMKGIPKYNRQIKFKQAIFYKNNYKLISLYPTSLAKQWEKMILIKINKIKNKKKTKYIITEKENIPNQFELILYLILIITPPIGWIILYFYIKNKKKY